VSRKLIVFCSLTAAILIAVIGWFFFHLLTGDRDASSGNASDGRTEVMCAVPMDAIALYLTSSLSGAEGVISAFAPEFRTLFSALPDGGNNLESALSVHSTGKNKLSLLLVCVIPESVAGEDVLSSVRSLCAGVIQKRYEASVIYRSSVPDINFSIHGHYFLCSSSLALLESAMRLLESEESLLDNPTFVNAVKNNRAMESLVLNHTAIPKLISSVARPFFRKYSAFASHITDWSSFEVNHPDEGVTAGKGTLSHFDEKGRYSYVLSGQKGMKSDLTDVLPYNTESVTSIRISDMESLISCYSTFKYSLGRRKQPAQSALSMARTAGITEVARASIRMPFGTEPVILVKADSPNLLGVSEGVDSCRAAAVPSAVAGNFFMVDDSSACCYASDEWVLMGSWNAVNWYMSASRNVNFFTLSDWLSQTPVKGGGGRNTIVSMLVNISMKSDSLDILLADKYKDAVRSALGKHNFNYFTFTVNSDGDGITPEYSLYSTDLEQMPSLRRSVISPVEECGDTTVQIPNGPYRVVDFRNGKENTLEQLKNDKLCLSDDRGKALWTIPFSGKICGIVSQIDYLKNGKLQMLLASGNKIYLINRLGGMVKPYPVETEYPVIYGPAVFDFKGDKDYLLGILHSDNVIRFYDRDGNRASGYGDLTASERIKALPEPIMTESHFCWAIRTSGQTLIVNTDGIPVANFNRKRRLAPDTEIKVVSPDELVVTSYEGKSFVLNIVTGNFSKQ